MNLLNSLKKAVRETIQQNYGLTDSQIKNIQIDINIDKSRDFGDLSCNASLVLAKIVKKSPIEVAQELKTAIEKSETLTPHVESVDIAGPGFINISLMPQTWQKIALELLDQKDKYFVLDETEEKKSFLVEYVSANPTGPLHLGHGRGGIIGDVLSNVLGFLGHKADREFYINDAVCSLLLVISKDAPDWKRG